MVSQGSVEHEVWPLSIGTPSLSEESSRTRTNKGKKESKRGGVGEG